MTTRSTQSWLKPAIINVTSSQLPNVATRSASVSLISSRTRITTTTACLPMRWLSSHTITSSPRIGLLVGRLSLPRTAQSVKKYIEGQLTARIPNLLILDRYLPEEKQLTQDVILKEFDDENIPYVIGLTDDVLMRGVTMEQVHLSRLVDQIVSCYQHSDPK